MFTFLKKLFGWGGKKETTPILADYSYAYFERKGLRPRPGQIIEVDYLPNKDRPISSYTSPSLAGYTTRPKRVEEEDDTSSVLNTLATAALMQTIIDTPSYDTPSVDSGSSTDLGSFDGFNGGDTGGGGAGGDW